MKAQFTKYTLDFKQPGGTSRGVLHTKDTYFIHLENEGRKGIGECNLFRGLSADDRPDYEKVLNDLCFDLSQGVAFDWEKYREFPSLQFGVEQALLSLQNNGYILFPSAFTREEEGIKINGLIWMGDVDFMQQQIEKKLEQGFDCLKLKIGTHWEQEHQVLQQLRKRFSANDLELRVDANGAFSYTKAQQVLEQLAQLKIHSIEQPIQAGNWQKMKQLCAQTPTPIALDEELIGVWDKEGKENLLANIQPQYIILKPALVGGFKGSEEWISFAKKHNVSWWITSALESNVGLNALAQWTFTLQNPLPQGLGTGGVFKNNVPPFLKIKKDKLWKQ